MPVSGKFSPYFNRRLFLSGSLAAAAVPAVAQDGSETVEYRDTIGSVRRNASSFRALDWEPYFDNTRRGAILVDLSSRALHYWSGDGNDYRVYPTERTTRERSDVGLRTGVLVSTISTSLNCSTCLRWARKFSSSDRDSLRFGQIRKRSALDLLTVSFLLSKCVPAR